MFVGIDPGWSGGIAYILGDAYHAVALKNMTPADIVDWMESRLHNVRRVALEKVHTMPGQGIRSAGSFMHCAGLLEGILAAAHVSYILVSPQRWQRDMGLIVPSSKKLTQVQKKNINKEMAQSLFPALKVTHATADALLLAEWCRRHYTVGGGEA